VDESDVLIRINSQDLKISQCINKVELCITSIYKKGNLYLSTQKCDNTTQMDLSESSQ